VSDEILIAIAGTSAGVWTGALIAFALKRRYTPKLSYGLDYLRQAFSIPIIFMALPTWAFEAVTIAYAIGNSFLALLQFRLGRAWGGIERHGKITYTAKATDGNDLGKVGELRAAQAVEDAVNRLVKGGMFSIFTVLVFSGVAFWHIAEVVQAICAVELMVGTGLVFEEIVGPLNPILDKPKEPVSIWRLALAPFRPLVQTANPASHTSSRPKPPSGPIASDGGDRDERQGESGTE
jgi:hypothetical protein